MSINIVCDYRLRPEWRKLPTSQQMVWLSADPRRGNVYLRPFKLEKSLGASLDPLSRDLCEIAAYVYLADKIIPRGQSDKWVRDLTFLVPVRAPARWKALRSSLTHTVSTLSGDNVRFRFFEKHEDWRPIRSSGQPKSMLEGEASDCVALFSGGLDSFAGALFLAQQGRRPLLASHYVSGLKKVQQGLATKLGERLGRSFQHFQYRVTSHRGPHTVHPVKSTESTHRARSFLFMSFAAAAAAVCDLSEIFICENGILSLNVPISDARKGTRSTRHAHPLYLTYFNQLINELYGKHFSICNPFFYWTKREEVELLGSAGLQAMIQDTVSCWGYPNLTIRYRNSNHCGICIPCIVRRVSMIAAGLEDADDNYALNVLNDGAEIAQSQRRNIEDLVYFAECFMRSSRTNLLYRYPELVMVESTPQDGCRSRLDSMIELYRRFARDLLAIVTERAPHLLSGNHRAA